MSRGARDPAISFAGRGHDHDACVAEALGKAEAHCARRGARLTALRRRVLELVWSSHAPIGAYDVLRRLSRDHARAAPPTVYRALDFLLAQGLVHRIECLNAFVGCADPDDGHAGQFLICQACGAAAELDDPRVKRAITRGAAELGFTVAAGTVEVRGLCPSCRDSKPGAGLDG